MAQKYILGDLVKVILDDEEQVVKVIGYDPTYKSYLLANEYIYETRGCISVTEDKIKPIHLTRKILEKNGWYKGTCEFVHYRKKFGSLVLRLTGLKYGWIIRCGNMCLIKRVKFIHQLQHFLFGLGLNSEMEV